MRWPLRRPTQKRAIAASPVQTRDSRATSTHCLLILFKAAQASAYSRAPHPCFLAVGSGSIRKLFGFPALPFGLEPKLLVPSGGPAVLYPQLPRTPSDPIFRWLGQRTGAPLQLFRERRYALCCFAVGDPASEALILFRFCQRAVDELLAVHANQRTKASNCSLPWRF